MWKHASFLPLMKRKDCCGGGGGGHARAREPYSQPPTPASQCSPSALMPIPPFVLPPPRQRERNTAKTHLAVHTDVGNTVVRVDTVVTEGAGIGPARSRAHTQEDPSAVRRESALPALPPTNTRPWPAQDTRRWTPRAGGPRNPCRGHQQRRREAAAPLLPISEQRLRRRDQAACGTRARVPSRGLAPAILPSRCPAVPPPLVCWRGSCAARRAAARHARRLLAALSGFWPVAARAARAAHAAHAAVCGPFSPLRAAPPAALPRVRPGGGTHLTTILATRHELPACEVCFFRAGAGPVAVFYFPRFTATKAK